MYEFKSLDFFNLLDNDLDLCEKLEFLGDGILNSFIVSSIYKNFVSVKNLGQIARIKSLLISRNNFSLIVDKLNLLTERLKSRSVKRKSDILEVFFGAIYFDSNYKIKEVENIYVKYVEPILFDIISDHSFFDFKSVLQCYSQKEMKLLPKYELLDHFILQRQHSFVVRLNLNGYFVISKGSSLRIAEQTASRFMVDFLGINIEELY